tara:strand:- start:161 stop:421 length:261 start_codon:yes stop_codon:yes gene_type:complete
MSCEARTYADGSWFCQKCEIGGDKDEPVEQFCKLTRSNALVDADYSALELRVMALGPEAREVPHLAYGGTVTGRFYGTAHSHPAER